MVQSVSKKLVIHRKTAARGIGMWVKHCIDAAFAIHLNDGRVGSYNTITIFGNGRTANAGSASYRMLKFCWTNFAQSIDQKRLGPDARNLLYRGPEKSSKMATNEKTNRNKKIPGSMHGPGVVVVESSM